MADEGRPRWKIVPMPETSWLPQDHSLRIHFLQHQVNMGTGKWTGLYKGLFYSTRGLRALHTTCLHSSIQTNIHTSHFYLHLSAFCLTFAHTFTLSPTNSLTVSSPVRHWWTLGTKVLTCATCYCTLVHWIKHKHNDPTLSDFKWASENCKGIKYATYWYN